MSIKYLLDTNVLSEPLRPIPHPHVMAMLQKHQHQIATASIVWHELNYGLSLLENSKKRAKIAAYLTEVIEISVPILPYDAQASHWHAIERARLHQLGKPIPFADLQLASIAITNSLVFISRNVSDFEHVKGLELDNWHL